MGEPTDVPPLYSAGGIAPPPGARTFWLEAAPGAGFAKGARLRAAYWPQEVAAPRGTALLLQGRTEFIEKHYEPIERLLGLGFNVFTLDWRGQGLSQRPLADRRRGHVGDFAEYQKDVDAAVAKMVALGAPGPWLLVCHSMGGAIGARALMRAEAGALEGPGFAAATLSAPMLGLAGAGGGLAASIGASAARMVGFGGAYAPGGSPTPYSEAQGFDGNLLTSDPTRFKQRLSAMLAAHPDLALGGATWGWLSAARREMPRLRPTGVPTLVAIGDRDGVVSVAAARAYAEKAPKGAFLLLEGARHEPFLETEPVQARLWEAVGGFLDRWIPQR